MAYYLINALSKSFIQVAAGTEVNVISERGEIWICSVVNSKNSKETFSIDHKELTTEKPNPKKEPATIVPPAQPAIEEKKPATIAQPPIEKKATQQQATRQPARKTKPAASTNTKTLF